MNGSAALTQRGTTCMAHNLMPQETQSDTSIRDARSILFSKASLRALLPAVPALDWRSAGGDRLLQRAVPGSRWREQHAHSVWWIPALREMEVMYSRGFAL